MQSQDKLAGSDAIAGSLVQTHYTTCCYYLAGLWCTGLGSPTSLLLSIQNKLGPEVHPEALVLYTFFSVEKEILMTDASQQGWSHVKKKKKMS